MEGIGRGYSVLEYETGAERSGVQRFYRRLFKLQKHGSRSVFGRTAEAGALGDGNNSGVLSERSIERASNPRKGPSRAVKLWCTYTAIIGLGGALATGVYIKSRSDY